MFDANGDNVLGKDEYEAYLRGIGKWRSRGEYSPKNWDARWPAECDDLESGTDGVAWEAFESVLYRKFRLGKAHADLETCQASGS